MPATTSPGARELSGVPALERSLGHIPAARPWLATLPSLIEQVRDRFGVALAEPVPGASCSWVAAATRADGSRVVVKIGWPHREMYGEPAALRLWDGTGAVRLLAHDPEHHALLLARCEPGHPLATDGDDVERRLRSGCGVLRRLWEVPPPEPTTIEPLGLVTADWADLVEERMARLAPGFDPGLVADGADLLRTLPRSAPRQVVVHGDFNPGNILSDSGTWLAIDPKPMIGDPGYDPWPLLIQLDDPFAYPDPVRVLRRRVALVADELSLERDRIVHWAIARTVESALWSAGHGDWRAAAETLQEARTFTRL